MKKKVTVLLISLCIVVCLFSLVACSTNSYELKFVVDDEIIKTINTNGKEVIQMPENPTKDGYTFDGWYWDKDVWQKPFTANSLLDEPLSSDMSVYAKFSDDGSVKGTNIKIAGFVEKNDEELGKCLYISLPNNTKTYLLNDLVEVNNKSEWTLSTDIGGINIIPSKSVELEVGNNIFYVVVKDNNKNVKPYTLLIRRKPLYSVSFNTIGGTNIESQIIEEESFAKVPTVVPEKEGYTFANWDYDFTQPITSTTTIKANYTANKYTITYDVNGGDVLTNNTQTVTYKEQFTLQIPTKTGYVFDGWYMDTYQIHNGNWQYAENITLTAKWIPKTYNIKYIYNGGVATNYITYNIETETFKINNPEKTGYTFAGWTYDNQPTPKKEVYIEKGSIGDKTYIANWTPINYNINYQLNGGTANNPNEYNIETNTFTLNNPKRTGYTFTGWTFEGQVEPIQTVTINNGTMGNKIYTANWEIIPYTITYNLNEGLATNPIEYNVETETFSLNNPTRNGYTFIGWTYEGQVEPTKNVNIIKGSIGNKTYTANWTPTNYNINYQLNGGAANNPNEYNIETNTFTLNNPKRTGYTFIGWTYEGQVEPTKNVNIIKGSIGNKTYTANWEIIPYTITYNLNEGLATNPKEYNVETETFTLNNPTRNGYTFVGWTSKEQIEPIQIVTVKKGSIGSKTYTANWTPTNYNINYQLNGGTANNPKEYNIETNTFTLNNPTKNGYIFVGWTYEGQFEPTKNVNIIKGSIGDKTYTANWEIIPYTITYNLNDGLATNPIEYNVETETFSLNNPTRNGYTFVGWTSNEQIDPIQTITINKGSIGNKTYTANWTPTNYNINYQLNGGIATNPKEYNIETNTFTLNNPTKRGYTFVGWTNNEQIDPIQTITINKGSIGNKTYTANWTPTNYNINYQLNGGTATNPKEYNIETNTFILSNPTKNGYTFVGWTSNEQIDPIQTVTINKGSTGNKTYIANWTPNKYIVTYNVNGGLIENTKQEITYQQTDFYIPQKEGYIFYGWYSDETLNNKITKENMPAEDITLFADWELPDMPDFEYIVENDCVTITKYKGVKIDIEIPNQIKNKPVTVIKGLQNKNIQKLTIPSSIKNIKDGAFLGYDNLNKINIKDLSAWLKIDYEGWYANPLHCAHNLYLNDVLIEELTIPKEITTIKYHAFFGCTSLIKINIHKDVNYIGENAFMVCENLFEIKFEPNSTLKTIDTSAFGNCKKLNNVKLPNGIETINRGAFGGCNQLNNIIIPNTLKHLGEGTFHSCINLKTIEIPDSVKSIDTRVFYGCTNLQDVTLPKNLETINSELFQNCTALNHINIPNYVHFIQSRAFDGCSNLASIIIPSSVTDIWGEVFTNCNNLTIYCEADTKLKGWADNWNCNRPVEWKYNNITNKEKYDYVTHDNKVFLTKYKGTETIINIPTQIDNMQIVDISNIFMNNTSVTEITIPNGVFSIRNNAFSGCTSLKNITLPIGLKEIGKHAFENCYNLTDMIIPQGVTYIGNYAFFCCMNLQNITIPDSVIRIEDHAFWRCSNLTSIIIPDSVTYLGSLAFKDCSKLENITISANIKNIYSEAFNGCTNLNKIYFNGTITEWNAITKDKTWKYNVPATTVHCTDGDVAI